MNNPPPPSSDDAANDPAFSEAAMTLLERALPALLAAAERDSAEADMSAEQWAAYLTGSLPASDTADITRRVARNPSLRQQMRQALHGLRDAQSRPALVSSLIEAGENREIMSPIAQAWARWREARLNALLQRSREWKSGGEEIPSGEDSVGQTLWSALTESARRATAPPPARVALSRGGVGIEPDVSPPGSYFIPFRVALADDAAESESEILTLRDLRWERREIALTIAPLPPHYEKYSGGAVELQLILAPHQRQILGQWPLLNASGEPNQLRFVAPFPESAEARDLLIALLSAVLLPSPNGGAQINVKII